MTLADKTALNVLAKSSEAILLMLSSIVMVRTLSKAEYGTFLQIMLIANTVILFTLFGLPQSIYYFFHKTRNQRVFVLRNVTISIAIGLFAAFLIFILRSYLVKWFNNPMLAEFIWVAPLLILLRAPSQLREPFLVSHEHLLMNSALVLLGNTLFYVPVIFAALLSVSLARLLQVMVMSAGLELLVYVGAIVWMLSHIHTKRNPKIQSATPKHDVSVLEQLHYAFPIGASSYISIIGRQLDQYIVSVFFTPIDFAVYSRGALRIPFISSWQFTINDIMMPQYVKAYAENDIPRFLQIFQECVTKVAKINFAVFALFFAVASSLITFLYTDEYAGAAPIFRTYLLMLLFNITLYATVPRASGKTSSVMTATIFALATNIMLSLMLVILIGPVGAAIATVVSGIASAWYYLFQSCKILQISFSQIFPWKYLFRIFSIAILASVPIYILEALFEVNAEKQFMLLIIEGVLYGYTYLFFMLRKQLIEPEELALFQKWFRFDVQKFLCKITFCG